MLFASLCALSLLTPRIRNAFRIDDATQNANALLAIQAHSSSYKFAFAIEDSTTEGTFICENTGEPLSYTNWASNEPNDYGTGEDCAEILSAALDEICSNPSKSA